MSGNELSIAELVQISHRPEMAFGFPLSVQEYYPSEYEKRMLSSLICNLVGIGITEVGDIRKVGRVMSVEISPYQKKDPTILICNDMNLSAYYWIWGHAVKREQYWNGWDYENFRWSSSEFSKAMKTAIRSARNLIKEEVMFAVVEALSFQNEMMLR